MGRCKRLPHDYWTQPNLGVENCADILMHYFEKLEYI